MLRELKHRQTWNDHKTLRLRDYNILHMDDAKVIEMAENRKTSNVLINL